MQSSSSKFFTQLKDYLSKDDVTIPRHILILSGDKAWLSETVTTLLQGSESRALWISKESDETVSDLIPHSSFKKAAHWLGGEKKVVVFDAYDDFDVDAFAAISGVVIGGGVFVLLMPNQNKWNDIYSSLFGHRLLKSIVDSTDIMVVNQNDTDAHFQANQSNYETGHNIVSPFLTNDQQFAVESIEEQVLNKTNNPIVLISDRGRGKSATLGIAAARCIKSGIKKIVITAPRLRATDIVFKHILEILPEAVYTRGRIDVGESSIQFFSPDKLILDDIKADILLIDEAAGIPVQLLTTFLKKYPQCIYATTVHGYEGTGRGFSLRFNKILNEHNPAWIKLQMQTPIRWPDNDPLEKWVFDLLCLDAEVNDVIPETKIDLQNIKHQILPKAELSGEQSILKEIFALLVLAHYRTRPKDLKSLLDDEEISLYVTIHNKHVVAVALVINEGNFPKLLSSEVYRGDRRPPGHLLAQALTYHCGIEQAATLDYARVMRIAVHPELQEQGIGTELLNFIINNEKKLGRNAIGASFGMNESLLRFWRKINFNIVRIGFTREKTSGEHAAIMLLPLNDKGQQVCNEAVLKFNERLSYWFDDVLKDLSKEVKNTFKLEQNSSVELTVSEKNDLYSFIHYSRNFELCISALSKYVMANKNIISQNYFPESFRNILNEKVMNKLSWKEVGEQLNLSGKNEARKLFHRAILFMSKE